MTIIKLKKNDLIDRANRDLECFPGYIKGMKIETARMEEGSLVIGGFCFINKDVPVKIIIKTYTKFAENFVKKYTLFE